MRSTINNIKIIQEIKADRFEKQENEKKTINNLLKDCTVSFTKGESIEIMIKFDGKLIKQEDLKSLKQRAFFLIDKNKAQTQVSKSFIDFVNLVVKITDLMNSLRSNGYPDLHKFKINDSKLFEL